jgi:uncharacterized membrane protein YkoI
MTLNYLTRKQIIWTAGMLTALVLLIIGGRALWMEVARPSAAPGELRVTDEKAQPITFPMAAFDTETVTLLTIVEPDADFDLALPPALPDGITVDVALKIAAEINPDAAVTEIRLKRERGVMVYRVEFNDRLRILIDARSGQILDMNLRGGGAHDETYGEGWLDETPLSASALVPSAQALQAVLDLFPETAPEIAVDEWELTRVEGRLVYDIELNNGFAVYVDATTGAVIETERE